MKPIIFSVSICCLLSLSKMGNAADAPPIFLEESFMNLNLHDSSSEHEDRVPSIGIYQGLEKNDNLESFSEVFPEADYFRIALVGGSIYSGLGQSNKYCFEDTKPFFLINKKEEKGIDCLMDWTSPELPGDLREQFHVIILEQLESYPLTKTQSFINAYQALRPGGILLFNTYRLSDFFIESENAMVGDPDEDEHSLDMQALKILNEDTKKLMKTSGTVKNQLRERTFFHYFASRLKEAGFKDCKWNFGENLIGHKLFLGSKAFRQFFLPRVDYNSGGWFEARKAIDASSGSCSSIAPGLRS